eukprot:m.160264 g.160264  ORF g.160264 m.160264 type:complete len:288 (-) comp23784_c0_seq5:2801-3664(-)
MMPRLFNLKLFGGGKAEEDVKKEDYLSLDGLQRGGASIARGQTSIRVPPKHVDSSGKLSIAWQDQARFDKTMATEAGPRTVTLDLSHNHFRSFGFLRRFTQLQTLVLDHNDLTSLKIPEIPTLETLWLNHNSIASLDPLLEFLVDATPRLQHLSLLGNPCAPSFLNGGSLSEYIHYRCIVTAALPGLVSLDCSPITTEERDQVHRIGGADRSPRKSTPRRKKGKVPPPPPPPALSPSSPPPPPPPPPPSLSRLKELSVRSSPKPKWCSTATGMMEDAAPPTLGIGVD